MIQVLFKNLKESDFMRRLTIERMQATVEKFPDLKSHRIVVTLSMENSPAKPGPDLFTVKVMASGQRFKALILKKSDPNFYAALAEVSDHLLERLNRYIDRQRVKVRKQEREFVRNPALPEMDLDLDKDSA